MALTVLQGLFSQLEMFFLSSQLLETFLRSAASEMIDFLYSWKVELNTNAITYF